MRRSCGPRSSALDPRLDPVLLGSVATGKYVDLLLEALGERLRLPSDFVGRGDMSRGGLLLRAARSGEELDYVPVPAPCGAARARLGWSRPDDGGGAGVGPRAAAGARRGTRAPGGAPDRHASPTSTSSSGPSAGITKRDLLQYYADVAPVLLPHLRDRAMVMKRYPNGADGEVLLHEARAVAAPDVDRDLRDRARARATSSTSRWSQDLASLLWVVNLGCIDLNQWYARCDDVDRPDYLHFDLDPGAGRDASRRCCETALVVRDALEALGMPPLVEDHAARTGMHVYVPIVRGPAAEGGVERSPRRSRRRSRGEHPKLITAEYRIAKRPRGRVLVDYNQNAWGRTLASVYSVRPTPARDGLDAGHLGGDRARRRDRGLPHRQRPGARARSCGDLWKPLLADARTLRPGARCCERCRCRSRYAPMEATARRRAARGPRAGSTSPSGTASAASPSATATRSDPESKAGQAARPLLPRAWSSRSRALGARALRARRRDRDPGGRRALVRRAAAAHPPGRRAACGRWPRRIRPRSIVFDLLVDERGRSLVELPLAERRARLERVRDAVLRAGAADRPLAGHPDAGDRARLARAAAGGDLDGVIAKRLDLPYRSGERDGMLK